MVEESRDIADIILEDEGFAFSEMPDRTGGDDLVGDIVELDLQILGDDAGVVDGKDEIEVGGSVERQVGVTRGTGQNGELAVVGLEELGQEDIRVEVRGDIAEPQFLDEAVLEGLVGSFNSSFGLRGVGTDEVDAQGGQSALELGDALCLQAGFGIDAENTEFVAVEGNWQPGGAEVGLAQPGVREVALVVHELSGQNRTGGIVHEQQQTAFRSALLQPGVVGSVDLDQFSPP